MLLQIPCYHKLGLAIIAAYAPSANAAAQVQQDFLSSLQHILTWSRKKFTIILAGALGGPKSAKVSNDNKVGGFVQPNEIKILSVNVTTWFKHSSSILHSGADVVALQETRLSAAGIKQAECALKSRPESWHGIWGFPPGDIVAKTGNSSKTETGKSSHGGVAIIAKDKFTLLPTGRKSVSAKTLFETSRWCASAIPLGPKGATTRRFLHIISFYGIANKRYGGRHTQNVCCKGFSVTLLN